MKERTIQGIPGTQYLFPALAVLRNAEFGMRPKPFEVQGSPALHVVQGGLRNGKE
jgi:hypothetical protein